MNATERDEYIDGLPNSTDDAISMAVAALAGIRYDLTALVGEVRDLRYAVERGR